MFMNTLQPCSRRRFLSAGVAMAGAGILQACSSTQQPVPPVKTHIVKPPSDSHVLRVFASSGYGESHSRTEVGLQRLYNAGFVVTNQNAAYRRYQRFAGSDAERVADLQDVAAGRVATPKVLMGFRGGYGAMRILPQIDWASLGSRMRESGTLLFGFSDVTAVQMALLAQSTMCSFAGPMLYSEFAKPQLSVYTMQAFIDSVTQPQFTVAVDDMQSRSVSVEGTLWGGNLSIVSALAGSPYMPDINGGILFLEDVGEQPYRIERMLQTLYLSGVLQKQQAIVLGHFNMGAIRDVYDSSYTLSSVVQTLARVAKVPVLTGFPFGHITNKITFPLGARARIQTTGNGGYQIQFSQYPTLNATLLSLNTLLPPPPIVDEATGNTGEPAAVEDNNDMTE